MDSSDLIVVKLLARHERTLGRLQAQGLPPKGNQGAIIAPTAADDAAAGYQAGSIWIDRGAQEAYICIDATAGAALWKQMT